MDKRLFLFALIAAARIAAAADIPQAAQDYLDSQTDIDRYEVVRVEVDELRQTHVRVQQRREGRKVFGGEAIVHVDSSGRLDYVSDYFARDLKVEDSPRVSQEDAEQLAAFYLIEQKLAIPKGVDATDLVYYRTEEGRDYLCYKVDFETCAGGEPVAFVDSQTGSVIETHNNQCHNTGQSVYQGVVPVTGNLFHNNLFRLEDTLVRWAVFDGQDAVTGSTRFNNVTNQWFGARHPDGVELLRNLRFTHWYFIIHQGFSGMNGTGGPFMTTAADGVLCKMARAHSLHENSDGSTTPNNAFYSRSSRSLNFGHGDGTNFGPVVSIDVVAHEYMHGITHHTADLTPGYQPGAINESFSDVFGCMVERYAFGAANSNFTIAEQCFTPAIPGDALRSMTEPELFGQPDHYSERYIGLQDGGGVHINAGIGNKAFALVALGGDHSNSRGDFMTGIGPDKAAKIWFYAMRYGMAGLTRYNDAKRETRQAAKALYGNNSTEHKAVKKAWDMCGV